MTLKLDAKNWLEWIVFAVSFAIVLGVIGTLGYETWQATPAKPAALELQLGEAEDRAGLYAIPVVVSNTGDETAEGVQIEVSIERADGAKEQSQFEIQFLPPHAERRGYAIFESNPQSATKITARPLGYQRP